MLKYPLKYQVARFSHNKHLWNWSELFKDIFPHTPRGFDIDAGFEHRGRHLFIEAKPLNASISKGHARYLESIAQKYRNSVLLVGLRNSCDDAFNPSWSLACWTWINHYQWRDPEYMVVGSDAEFKEMLLEWKARIDRREDQLRQRHG